jgi:hypothetical protein
VLVARGRLDQRVELAQPDSYAKRIGYDVVITLREDAA